MRRSSWSDDDVEAELRGGREWRPLEPEPEDVVPRCADPDSADEEDGDTCAAHCIG